MDDTGSITIETDDQGKTTVKARLVDANVWMTKHEIAYLFNVFTSAVDANLRSIFKSQLLFESQVTRQYRYQENGKDYTTVYYNLETIIFLSFRIGSWETIAFREWVMNALFEYNRSGDKKGKEVIILYNPQARKTNIVVTDPVCGRPQKGELNGSPLFLCLAARETGILTYPCFFFYCTSLYNAFLMAATIRYG